MRPGMPRGKKVIYECNYVSRDRINPDEQRFASFRKVGYELWSDELYRAYRQVRLRQIMGWIRSISRKVHRSVIIF